MRSFLSLDNFTVHWRSRKAYVKIQMFKVVQASFWTADADERPEEKSLDKSRICVKVVLSILFDMSMRFSTWRCYENVWVLDWKYWQQHLYGNRIRGHWGHICILCVHCRTFLFHGGCSSNGYGHPCVRLHSFERLKRDVNMVYGPRQVFPHWIMHHITHFIDGSERVSSNIAILISIW